MPEQFMVIRVSQLWSNKNILNIKFILNNYEHKLKLNKSSNFTTQSNLFYIFKKLLSMFI